MSTDLQLCQDLPKLNLPSSNFQSHRTPALEESNAGNISDDEGCRTPTSAEHKIPAALVCPPAPRKPKWRAPVCKRKLSFFFEVVRDEELESFFRSCDAVSVAKRRCPCI
ncbi:cyclin-dependent protein kinase inhibitor SIM [Carica papaya]|uniref:cyclin-dependent protein kinase inhibitor SIM n=1 Tax=Carica papaya TaxID=3649 RepID=UPI000B8C9ED4|nr:cyclin-dependent protein kinase inhibitor SIM [Carica papaya]